MAHSRQVYDHAAVTGAEAGQAVSTTADGSKNPSFGGCPDCVSHIAYIGAACDQTGLALEHAVPNKSRIFITAGTRAQQIALELAGERGISFFDSICALSVLNVHG